MTDKFIRIININDIPVDINIEGIIAVARSGKNNIIHLVSGLTYTTEKPYAEIRTAIRKYYESKKV